MAGTIVGHFDSITEVERLTQSMLLSGLVQETYEEGQLASVFGTMQIKGLDVTYRRRGTPLDGAFYDIHEQIPWTSGETNSSVTVGLKRIIRQDILDDFVAENYNSHNDYKAIVLSDLREGVMRTAEDKFIYGNATTNSKEFDGLHALVPAANRLNAGASSTGAALSLNTLRQLVDTVKPRPDFLLVRRAFGRRLDAILEDGIVNDTGEALQSVTHLGGSAMVTRQNLGSTQDQFRNTRILYTDFITQEETLSGGDFSAKTGGATTTIFAIRTGRIESGGLEMVIGSGIGSGPSLFTLREFDALEDYDAGGFRLRSWLALALGSTKALACIDGITDVNIVR